MKVLSELWKLSYPDIMAMPSTMRMRLVTWKVDLDKQRRGR